jgi:predicted O-methyltransferase YrrM
MSVRALLPALLLPLLLPAADPSEQSIRQYQHRLLVRQRENMNVDPADGEFFYSLTEKLAAKRVLEIGTSNGYSGSWFAMGLRKTGGKLVTLEINTGRHKEALDNFTAMGLAAHVDARLGDALALIPTIDGPFDIVFIDANKSDYLRYYEMVLPKVRKGGVILAHNTRDLASSMRPFLERIQSDPAVRTEFLEGSLQGVSISWKK